MLVDCRIPGTTLGVRNGKPDRVTGPDEMDIIGHAFVNVLCSNPNVPCHLLYLFRAACIGRLGRLGKVGLSVQQRSRMSPVNDGLPAVRNMTIV